MATIVNTSLNTEPRLGNLRYNISTMERSVNPVMSVDVEKFGKGEDLSDTKPTQKIHESFEWLSAIFNGAASNRVMNTMRIAEDENCAPRIFVGRQANLVPLVTLVHSVVLKCLLWKVVLSILTLNNSVSKTL